MRIAFTMMCFFIVSKLFAQGVCCQELIGMWQLQPHEEGLFKIYAENMKSYDLLVRDQDFFVDDGIYGFYTDCSPSNINDLKRQGTGEFFFEVSDYGIEIKDGGVLDQRMLNCLSIQIDKDGEDTFLRFGRASLAEYKKVYKLPERLEEYLKKEQPKVYEIYCELGGDGK